MAMQPATSGSNVERPGAGTLSDVITTILDKGLVIDVYARVSLVGIELLRADVRVVVASVDTYLRFAEAVNRLAATLNSDVSRARALAATLRAALASIERSSPTAAIQGRRRRLLEPESLIGSSSFVPYLGQPIGDPMRS